VVKESAENEQLSAELRQWAGEQKAILDAKSPSGMAVALESYKRAKAAKRLDNTLLNDMAMATAFSVSHDSA
jgi:3-hydroxyisobutyryl-CoA hydrolase